MCDFSFTCFNYNERQYWRITSVIDNWSDDHDRKQYKVALTLHYKCTCDYYWFNDDDNGDDNGDDDNGDDDNGDDDNDDDNGDDKDNGDIGDDDDHGSDDIKGDNAYSKSCYDSLVSADN